MLSLRVALRYLFSKKSHNAVNIISVVSMLGVGVATAAIVCVLSVFNGFSDLAQSRMSAYDPAIKAITAEGKVIGRGDSLALAISSLPEIDTAVATITEQAVAIYNSGQIAVELRGIPSGYTDVVDIDRSLIDGEWLTSTTEAPVATLSVGTAMRLKAFPGSDRLIGLYVPKRIGKINSANPMASFKTDSLFIGGVIRTDESEIDGQTIYVPLTVARELLEYYDGEASAIEIKPKEGVSDDEAIAAIGRLTDNDVILLDRMGQEAESFKMISVEKWITFVMLAFILVIASFNVISTLSMLIIEKRDNMSTLRSMGADSSMIRRIFMWEGWLITLTGGLLGCIIGISLSVAQQYGGFIKLSGDPSQLAVTVYPVRVAAIDVVIVMMMIMVIGFSVGWITSRFVNTDKKQ